MLGSLFNICVYMCMYIYIYIFFFHFYWKTDSLEEEEEEKGEKQREWDGESRNVRRRGGSICYLLSLCSVPGA